MSQINSEFNLSTPIEGILDVGPLVIAHYTNPIQEQMIDFLAQIFEGNRNIIIPLSTFIGAYHILTRYLKISRFEAKSALVRTLQLNSPLFYPVVDKIHVLTAMDFASIHNIESWDAYLIALGKSLGTRNIYTIDKKLRKIREINVILPVLEEELEKYHQWLKKQL